MAEEQNIHSSQTRTSRTRRRKKDSKVAARRAVSSAVPRRAAAPVSGRGVPPMRSETAEQVTPEERWNLIALAAYYRAEKRGFVGGDSEGDWWAAEKEVDDELGRREE